MTKTVGIIGGGTMGSGIGYQAAVAGYEVVICDVGDDMLRAAQVRVEQWGRRAVKKGSLQDDELGPVLKRIRYTATIEEVGQAAVVIEAVPEILETKQAAFESVAAHVPESTLLCSNTSGLSITSLATAVPYPPRLIGTHFFNPVPVMRLVEVVRGELTGDAAVDEALAFARSLDKESIVVKDRPGFVVTRIGQAMINEAIRCLEEGVADAESIDRGMRLGYHYPMGPLELADLVGLDVELAILEDLRYRLGEGFLPPASLRNKVAAGLLGKKTGRGFYQY